MCEFPTQILGTHGCTTMASPQDSPRDNDAPRDDGDDAPARRSRSRSPADRRERSRSRSPRGRSRSRSRSPARGGYGSSPPPRGERKTGVAGRWNPRGFGFITPDQGGEDLFCHFSSITDGNMVSDRPDHVAFIPPAP